jgi:hypothetical protein
MPEYAAELPLWYCNWEELGLPSELVHDLADWQAEFDANFHPSKGWIDSAVRERWEQGADRLTQRLRKAPAQGNPT